MQLVSDLRNDIKDVQNVRIPSRVKWFGAIGALLCCLLLLHFGRFDLASPTINCLVVLGFVITLKWKLRRYVWFWIAMIIVAALHILFLMFVPWTTTWILGLVVAAIDAVDLLVILAILSVVRRFMERPKIAES
jgi:hypothetical protein